jgi:hypothetical protein
MKNKDQFDKKLLLKFEEAVSKGKESEIHSFIEKHPQILDFMCRGGFLKSKFHLADAFIPDFLAVGKEPLSQSLKPMVTFIEIERANASLFTKSGDPSSFLTHAIRQVQDWKQWVQDNRTYLHTVIQRSFAEQTVSEDLKKDPLALPKLDMAHGFNDRFLVIAGRRKSLKLSDRLRLSQMSDDLHHIKLITYNALIENLLMHMYLRDKKIHKAWFDFYVAGA